jgi:hypothetical protein
MEAKIDLGELKNEGLWKDFSWFRIWFSCGNEARISLSSWRKRTSKKRQVIYTVKSEVGSTANCLTCCINEEL